MGKGRGLPAHGGMQMVSVNGPRCNLEGSGYRNVSNFRDRSGRLRVHLIRPDILISDLIVVSRIKNSRRYKQLQNRIMSSSP